MFRIAFTVRDNSLAKILKGLDGKAFDMEVRPVGVTSAKTARREPGAWLAGLPNTFSWGAATAAIGKGPSSTSSYIKSAIDTRMIKKVGRGKYAKI